MSGTLTVDLAAVAANVELFAARTPALMAVVKANGFGHGAVAVARCALAHGAVWLGVTSLEEALALRSAGLTAPILSWLNPIDADFGSAIRHQIDLAVPDLAHLHAVLAAGIGARIHLHLDTGMARDGAEPERWPALCRAARRAERAGSLQVVGVMGHLGCADVPGDPANARGRDQFCWGLAQAARAGLRPRWRHLAATSATLTDPCARHSLCRVGAGLVGIDPTGSTVLAPALRLTAPVVGTRCIRAGTAVGYGHAWAADRSTSLALLPIGYADGLPRGVDDRAAVWLAGRRRPVVGRVSMDQIVVDVGDDEVAVGTIATIFGPGQRGEPTAAEWAQWAGTIEHEIVTGIGARVERSWAA